MSKSYYKYPSFKDYSRSYTRWAKRQASKAARRNWNIDDGSSYKKAFCRYNIFDYRSTYYTDQEVLDSSYADAGEIYKINKKSFVKNVNRETIRRGLAEMGIRAD